MKHYFGPLQRAILVLALSCLFSGAALGQAAVTNPEALASTVNGVETATLNSQIIFRANIDFGTSGTLDLQAGKGPAAVFIDPPDAAVPGNGATDPANAAKLYPLTLKDSAAKLWVAYIPASAITAGTHRWSIVARNNSNGGPTTNGVAGTPLSSVKVVPNQQVSLLPVDEFFIPDKASATGQTGNGLRLDPASALRPNDGSGAHVYTWRVRVQTNDGLPPQFFNRVGDEWGQNNPNAPMQGGVILYLTGPDGITRRCPMEIDPTAPGQAGLQAFTYPLDPVTTRLVHPQGGDVWKAGVYFRYRMMPTQYRRLFLGGPTSPDPLFTQPLGGDLGGIVFGRPVGNVYAGFSVPSGTAFPRLTNTTHRAGQWTYYYAATADLRPFPIGGAPQNGSTASYPNDPYGTAPGDYLQRTDSDDAGNPANLNPYGHPYVSIILSDGGWTDDLEINGYPGANNGPAHRSRLTTKTTARFMVRVTRPDNTPLLSGAVRVWIDGTPNVMSPLAIAGNNDYTTGVIYYYDTIIPSGREGQHWIYFDAADSLFSTIWPRRPSDDVQAASPLPYFPFSAFVARPGATVLGIPVGKNIQYEPYVNHSPQLSDAAVTPATGLDSDSYTFTVTYKDADNDAPLQAFVIIDGVQYPMTAANNNPITSGRQYTFVKDTIAATPDGKHNYYFRFRENWAVVGKEYGDIISLPAGDANGNPSTTITGPVVIGDKAPELINPSVVAGDPSNTTATLYDFLITYKDFEGDPPSSLKVFVSADGGLSYDSGTAMVKADGSTNYVTGVQYHLATSTRLPATANLRYKFDAIDSRNSETISVHVGTGNTSISTGLAATLTSINSPTNTMYEDPAGTKNWISVPGSLFVWLGNGPTPTLLQAGVDFTVDPVSGRITLNNPNTAGLPVRASYFYIETVGPVVKQNTPPVLSEPTAGSPTTNNGTLSPLQGTSSTNFVFSVIYTDADNQPPSYVRIVRDDPLDKNAANIVAMTIDPTTPKPIDYRKGVKYTAKILGSAIGLKTHTYHFTSSDGADTSRLPVNVPDEYSGPTVADTGDLSKPTISPYPTGRATDTYAFTVTYRDLNPPVAGQGRAPAFPIEVRILRDGDTIPTAVTLAPIDPVGATQYAAGVRYQTKITAPAKPLLPGRYTVTYGYQGLAASTAPLILTVNGAPTLSNPAVSPASVSQAGDVTITVRYADPNGDAPTRGGVNAIKLFIDGTEFTTIPYATAPASPVPADFVTGVDYRWVIPVKDFTLGNHTYYITAQDELDDAVPSPIPSPPGSFSVVAAKVPTLTEPGGNAGNNNGTLTPLTGAQAGQFTFSAKYTHPDNVAPVSIQVIIDPGANQTVRDLVPPGGPLTYSNGVVYSYQTAPGELAGGAHTYKFQATDRIVSVSLPTSTNGTYSGPIVNHPPVLTNGTVTVDNSASPSTINAQNGLVPNIRGSIASKFVFRITYQDANGVAPTQAGYVRAKLNGTQTINLRPKAGDPLNYTAGVVYESSPTALAAGPQPFHFESSDGLDTTRLPSGTTDVSGLQVGNLPSLLPVNAPPAADDGTLSPRTGRQSTNFTYTVIYQHPDGLAPDSVNVVIDGVAHQMTPTPGTPDYQAGVAFTYTNVFNAGTTHSYRFEAREATNPNYTAKYPTNGTAINGPSITGAVFTQPTFTSDPGVLGQPMTIRGSLVGASVGSTSVSLQVIRPDGSGQTAGVTTATDGTFTYVFTPDATGTWAVKLDWAGIPNVYDPVGSRFLFNVAGYSVPVPSGAIDMIALPLLPPSQDPNAVFGPTDGAGNPLPVTLLNLIKWVTGNSSSGQYLFLNTDGNFPPFRPGQSYWVKPNRNVTLIPQGTLADQTQPFPIPLNAGWNMIGSVYLQDINWSAVKVRANGQLLALSSAGQFVRPVAWSFDKQSGGYKMVTLPNGVLASGRGYWVRAFSDVELVLSPPGTRAATDGRDAVERSGSVQIAATSGNLGDMDNYAPLTRAGNNRLELQEKPPYVADHVNIKFISSHVELPVASRAAASTASNVVVFDVEATVKNADVTLQFPNLSAVGRKSDITLVDFATDTRRSLGSGAGVTYNTGENSAPRRFALIMNTASVNSRLLISNLQTSGGNSRSPVLSFAYNISGAATIKAQIIGGASGQTIRTLDTGRAVPQGTNTLLWDGRDGKGITVAAGSYLLKLTATDDKGRTAVGVLPVTVVR